MILFSDLLSSPQGLKAFITPHSLGRAPPERRGEKRNQKTSSRKQISGKRRKRGDQGHGEIPEAVQDTDPTSGNRGKGNTPPTKNTAGGDPRTLTRPERNLVRLKTSGQGSLKDETGYLMI